MSVRKACRQWSAPEAVTYMHLTAAVYLLSFRASKPGRTVVFRVSNEHRNEARLREGVYRRADRAVPHVGHAWTRSSCVSFSSFT